jgi:hypothetical protein
MLLPTMRPRAPEVDPRELALVVRDLMPSADPFEARFELPVTGDRIYLNRAHPAIEGLASFVLESALDAGENRTVSGQLEHWARVGRAALENPDLPASFIAEALTSLGEPRSDAMPFVPRTPNQHT